MSFTAILFVVAALFGAAAVVLQIVMIVQGFKTSVGWGLVCLLVPGGAVVFAFAKTRHRLLSVALLVSLVVATTAFGFASYKTAQAFTESVEAAKSGMQEFDAQKQSLDNLNDLKL